MITSLLGPRSGGFRRLWLATLISLLGTWTAAVVLPLRVYDATGSTVWVSALLLAELVPGALVGLVFANRLSRLSPRAALIAADVAGAAVYLSLVWVRSPWPTFALALIAGFAVGIYRPLVTAVTPRMVTDSDLEAANASLSIVESGAMVVGQGLGGLLFVAAGPQLALGLNCGSFLCSAALVAGVSNLPGSPERIVRRMPLAQLRHAARLVRATPGLVQPAVIWPVCCLFLGISLALTIPLVRMALSGSPLEVGLAQAAISAGLVAGSAVSVRLRGVLSAWFPGVLAAMGACVVAAGLAPWYLLALPVLAGVGLANGLALVHVRSALQRGADADELPALAAFVVSCVFTATAAGSLLGGVAADIGSLRVTFAAAGWGVVMTAAGSAALAARVRASDATLEYRQDDRG